MRPDTDFVFGVRSYRCKYTPSHPRLPRQGEIIEVSGGDFDGIWFRMEFVAFRESEVVCYDAKRLVLSKWKHWRLIEEPKPEKSDFKKYMDFLESQITKPEPVKVPLTKKDFDGMAVVWLRDIGSTSDNLVTTIDDAGLNNISWNVCMKKMEYSTDRRGWKPCHKLVHPTQDTTKV